MITPNNVRLPKIDDRLASAAAERVPRKAMKPPSSKAPGMR